VQILENSTRLTEPEFSSQISKASGVIIPVAVEIHTAVFSSLKHLQCENQKFLKGWICIDENRLSRRDRV